MSPRIVGLLALAAAAAAPATAHAAYAPRVEIALSGTTPGGATGMRSTLLQAQGEEATRSVEATLPGAFGFNSGLTATGCPPAAEQAARCPEASRIGTLDAQSPFGSAHGSLFLTTDFRLHGVVDAYGGLFRFVVTGVMRVLPGQAIVVRFDDLPPIPTTRMSLAIDSGARSPLALPRVCGTHEVAVRLESHGGTARTSTQAVTVGGCRALTPAPLALRLDRRRIPAGGATTLRWRVRGAVSHTTVSLLHLEHGRWYDLGARRVRARPGANALRVGPRWRGRVLRTGAHRLEVATVGPDGRRSVTLRADLRVG